ncbi:hypothetical protein JX265_012394 [Neoarthrinium moseri]|uniref:Thiamine pyrophosphokinase n=1 Tax=Neoarthrinium moseri TaxID=1658444 RepID=A0A9P9WAI0_9PEZI|nr:hypothetical protein JX266_002986 [Neoarthrinium moseri]KAI1855039.1 hypothetical protein JX265_012394 [Neoarthrinium moseri]
MSPVPDGPTIEWHPALLLEPEPRDARFALLILNQPLNDLQTLARLWQNSTFHIAADGGANRLYDSNRRLAASKGHDLRDRLAQVDSPSPQADLDVIIGDLDSLLPETQEYFESANPSLQVIHEADQYSTDFAKAVRHTRSVTAKAGSGPADIVCMGGLGGRVDQGLSQLHHLYLFQTSPTYSEGRLYLVSGESLSFLLKAGRHRIHVREPSEPGPLADGVQSEAQGRWAEEVFGKHAGIIPVKEPSVITLKGFEWDVEDWPTEFGGQLSTSNHVLPESEVVEVWTSTDVLFTIALKGRGGED